ncbi:carbohydrate ABC transporter permease [Streptomyces sp. NPDC005931]|uniref:carbohydrate ABC transporter permease n=1 Tax=Streptomyces sp. NPDC005931 TaxID=3364737 RepID=UPI00369E97B5
MKTLEPAHAAAADRAQAASSAASAMPPRPSRGNRDRLHGLLMSAPAVGGLIAFVGIPFGYAVVLSFYNVRLGSPLDPTFFGVEHYRRLFTDPDLSGPFLWALLNNLTFAAVVVPL